jgi:hypothetical protein
LKGDCLSFDELLEIVNELLPGGPIDAPGTLAKLNLAKIYVENLRSALGVTTEGARSICAEAVRRGVFLQQVEVVCPGGAAAISADSEAQLPERVRYWDEKDGNYDEAELPTRELQRTVFYRLSAGRAE